MGTNTPADVEDDRVETFKEFVTDNIAVQKGFWDSTDVVVEIADKP